MPGLFVAETIKSQIGRNTLMCLGSRDFIGCGESEKDLGFLTFTVSNNPKIRGKVFVTVKLDFDDTYNVVIWKRVNTSSGSIVKIFNESKGVYCDMLSDTLFSFLG